MARRELHVARVDRRENRVIRIKNPVYLRIFHFGSGWSLRIIECEPEVRTFRKDRVRVAITSLTTKEKQNLMVHVDRFDLVITAWHESTKQIKIQKSFKFITRY